MMIASRREFRRTGSVSRDTGGGLRIVGGRHETPRAGPRDEAWRASALFSRPDCERKSLAIDTKGVDTPWTAFRPGQKGTTLAPLSRLYGPGSRRPQLSREGPSSARRSGRLPHFRTDG